MMQAQRAHPMMTTFKRLGRCSLTYCVLGPPIGLVLLELWVIAGIFADGRRPLPVSFPDLVGNELALVFLSYVAGVIPAAVTGFAEALLRERLSGRWLGVAVLCTAYLATYGFALVASNAWHDSLALGLIGMMAALAVMCIAPAKVAIELRK